MARFANSGSTGRSLKRINPERNDALSTPPSDINFSFKYLKEDNDFHLDHGDIDYLRTVIRRFRDLCSMTKLALMTDRSKALRAHPVDWSDRRVSRNSFSIPNETDLCAEAYQFSISTSAHGRIVGFFTGDSTFNIVWFDKDHKLYPGN